MVKKTRSRSKRGGQSFDSNQAYNPNQSFDSNQASQEPNWLENSWNKISGKANNLYNSITGPSQTPYGPSQTPYGPSQTPYGPSQTPYGQNQEKPWYKFWGGKQRSKSRKNRKTCKKRYRK